MLDRETAAKLARLPLAGLVREMPHKLDHVVTDDGPIARPRELHPAFYGCFDWHSAVHGFWMLARLRRIDVEVAAIDALFDRHLTVENLAIEAAYCRAHRGFERTYGWAWALALAAELRDTKWGAAMQPLADVIVENWIAFLPKQTYPIRTGVHANTAFGLAFALDYARAVGNTVFAEAVENRARNYYALDVDAPAVWEPSGEDFFSPCLMEADLMRRVLVPSRYAAWLHAFLPRLPANLAEPAMVTDRSDGKLAHLDGLNLSRAWCMKAIANALDARDLLRDELVKAADAHAKEGLAHVATGDYMGEHWLATFAVFLLETA